jgi:TolA-binding protein
MDVLWTPTALVLDANGKERFRIEGYLPREEFAAQLMLGLARVSFTSKKWADAEKIYAEITSRYPNSAAAPEAVYWNAVSHYKATNDHTVLGEVPKILEQKYPSSVWVKRAAPWAA